jgi:hypothetical protein
MEYSDLRVWPRAAGKELGETERGVGAAGLIEAASRSWVKVELLGGIVADQSAVVLSFLDDSFVDLFIWNES